jgi:hypothetical protein
MALAADYQLGDFIIPDLQTLGRAVPAARQSLGSRLSLSFVEGFSLTPA